MGNAHYKASKIGLRLKVRRRPFGQSEAPEAWREIPVSGMTLHFNSHAMPEASFMVPPGRDLASRANSTISELRDQLGTTWEVLAEMTLTGWANPHNRVSGKTFTVWRGVVIGGGYSSPAGTLQYTINSAHWLYYLDSATCTSSGVVKNSPYNLRARYSGPTSSAASKVGVQHLMAAAKKPPTDIWAHIVLPLLSAIMTPTSDRAIGGLRGSDTLWANTLSGASTIKLGNGVTQATALNELEIGNRTALKMLGGELLPKYNVGWLAELPTLNDPAKVNSNGLPAADLTWIQQNDIQGGVLGVIASIIANAAESQSPWDKLILLGREFFFRLLPCVESAAVVPYLPVTSSRDVWRILDRNSYVMLSGTGFAPSSLAGVGVYGRSSLTTKSPIVGQANSVNSGRLAGGFIASNRGKLGFFPLPSYLMSVRSGVSSFSNPISLAMDAAASMLREISGNNYAQMLWSEMVFAGRSIRVQTPLRFDIAPGSTILLRGLDVNSNQQVSEDPNKLLYGMVTGVRVVVDAISPSSVCEFTVTHLRNLQENNLGPEKHPLYYPAGAPLDYLSGNPLTPVGDDDLKPEAP